jgi:site-specific DNA-methyltransferase (adenine-specific)
MILRNDDCLKVLRKLPTESVDLVVTDCPYKIVQGGCTSNGKAGIFTKTDDVSAGKIFQHNEIKFKEWLPDVYRVLKKGTHCYIMINGRNLAELQIEAEKVGFHFQNLLVWKKNNNTPNRYYLQCLEFIILLSKRPALNINNMGDKNFFEIPNIKGKTHPTEKPVDLLKIFIENSSKEGQIVLDPFMGTGSTGAAAKLSNRKFIGIEIDEKYFKIAEARLNG